MLKVFGEHTAFVNFSHHPSYKELQAHHVYIRIYIYNNYSIVVYRSPAGVYMYLCNYVYADL